MQDLKLGRRWFASFSDPDGNAWLLQEIEETALHMEARP